MYLASPITGSKNKNLQLNEYGKDKEKYDVIGPVRMTLLQAAFSPILLYLPLPFGIRIMCVTMAFSKEKKYLQAIQVATILQCYVFLFLGPRTKHLFFCPPGLLSIPV